MVSLGFILSASLSWFYLSNKILGWTNGKLGGRNGSSIQGDNVDMQHVLDGTQHREGSRAVLYGYGFRKRS